MTITREPAIRSLPPAAAGDAAVITALTDLINEVYTAAEEGLWVEDATRTTAEEVAELTRAGQIAVARLGGRIVGCIRIRRLDGHTSEFGMLAAAPGCRGLGVGRALVRFAEQYSRDEGRGTMQLELLVPREWSHPSKEFLAGWYSRIGYTVVRTGAIDESYPNLAPLLATPCDFVTYQKDLGA